MKTRSKILIFGIATVALGAALALQTVQIRDVKRGDVTSPAQPIGLGKKVPETLVGWSAQDQPLGANESLRSAVERTLNYDDYVFRSYRRAGTEFAVYAAYWSVGRMPMEKVASHTPDRCWSENGWRCTKMNYPVTLSTEDGQLKPAYWRIFEPPGGSEPHYVMYWHLVGDELYDYGGGFNQRPGIVKWWSDMLRYAMSGSKEQFFIRLTSNRPFEELRGDAGFEQVLMALAELGLAAR